MSSERFSRLLRSWVYRVRPTNATSKRTSLLPRLRVQEFEERVVPAVLPLPTQTQPAASVSLLGIVTKGDVTGPVVVSSPTNPSNQVLVATVVPTDGQTGIVGFFSNDAGSSWLKFFDNTSLAAVGGPTSIARLNDNSIDPTNKSFAQTRYTHAYNPTVAFDRDGSVYLSHVQTNAAKTSGEIVFDSYTFGGTALNGTQSLYRWIGQDPAFNPYVVVDNNAPVITDPVTGGVRTDPSSGKGVYVTWNTNTTLEDQSVNPFQNQNAILIAGSADRGATFSNPVLVTDGGYTKNPILNSFSSALAPVAAFAPATSTTPGFLTIASTGKAVQTIGGNIVDIGVITIGGTTPDPVAPVVTQSFTGAGGAIGDGFDPGSSLPHIGGTTQFSNVVALTAPNFSTLSDLDVKLSITHANVSQLQVQLISPTNDIITLFTNRTQGDNSLIGSIGLAASANVGIVNGYTPGMIFNQEAPRRPNNGVNVAPYIAHFRPEFGSLATFYGRNAAALNGTWKLSVTDARADGTPTQLVTAWSLKFVSRFNNSGFGSDTVNFVSALTNGVDTLHPNADATAPATGIGTSLAIAYDTSNPQISAAGVVLPGTNAGRLYTAFTSAVIDFETGAVLDENVSVARSNNGGLTLAGVVRVNDDSANDHYSEGRRAQFMPAVAVDPLTGTLAVSWFDGRHDASTKRLANYVATSIDGGASFSAQGRDSYFNVPKQAIDTITGKSYNLEPIPNNYTVGTALTSGMGVRQSLLYNNGKLTAYWAGNQNSDKNFSILSARSTTGMGPRIVSSDMGPVGNSSGFNGLQPDGTPRLDGFRITFDRPVDPTTLTDADVIVQFRSPTTPLTSPATNIPVAAGAAIALNAANTTFFVPFQTPQTAVGTYSYAVGPNILDKHRGTLAFTTTTFPSTDTPLALPDVTTTTSTLTVAPIAGNPTVVSVRVGLNLTHTFDSDLRITLIAPNNTQVVLSNRNGGGGQNYTGTFFDDSASTAIAAGTPPFTGSFRPESPLSAFAGGPASGTWRLQIEDLANVDVGTLLNWTLELTDSRTSVKLGNSMDQNNDGTQSTSFGVDTYSTPRSTSGIPFSVPYATDTLPIIIPGPTFTFAAVPGKATAGTGDTLNLDTGATGVDVLFDREINPITFTGADIIGMTGPLGVVPGPFVVSGLGATAASPTKSFHIQFPSKIIANGPYAIEIGSDIQSTIGDSLDMNQNAGLAVLRGTDPNASSYSTVTRSTLIGQPVAPFSPSGSASLPLTVPDTFVIAQNLLLSPRSRVRVTVNLTHPNVKEIDLDLVSPDGLTRIRLFTGANILPAAPLPNLRNTIFDDGAVTPIQLGGVGQFNGIFNPELPLSGILGRSSFGNWTLQVRNNGTQAGTIDNWSLELPKADIGSGLGELVADRFDVGFRIFTQEPSQVVTKQQWTPFGPAPLGGQSRINRITGLALDESDPSGNTVFVGGASGGIWKTTNFLTLEAAGPNWIPLTDFGPSSSLNTGGIAVFARNNDPNQSIVFAVTGEGDVGSGGVGVLRSLDGGRNWKVLDSTSNADGIGNILPIDSALRNRQFVGTSSFKIIVDPKLTPTGEVIVYMANSQGIWRSNNTGRDWLLIQVGDATDVTLSAGSVSKSVGANNNLNILYTAIRGQGIFFSPNAQSVTLGGMQLTPGNQGNPLFQEFGKGTVIPVGAGARNNPNGPKGRITLAAPALSDSSLANDFYQGWLYAFVSSGGNGDLYQTKDFGRNWVRIGYPFFSPTLTSAFGTNNEGLGFGLPGPDHTILGAPPFGQGEYDIAIGIDPNNPSIVYLGGTNNGSKVSGGGFIRVDTTFVNDSQSLIAYNNSNNDGGTIQFTTGNGPISTKNATTVGQPYGVNGNNSINRGFINLFRDPTQPFLSNSTLNLTNVSITAGFNNSGFDAKWAPFPGEVQTDVHRIITFRDPLTGKSRIISGDDQGIGSTVDDGTGLVVGGIGNARFPNKVRNGNLQLNQIYYGASHPSQLAADIAGALFYATTQDNGFPISTASLLTTGDLGYSGPGGDGTGIATDQTGSGTSYYYAWPCCGPQANATDFFQVRLPNGVSIGRTSGLLQLGDQITATGSSGQWSFLGGHNFAVNPIDGNGIIMGSGAGRVFRTTDQGINWFPVGEPGGLNQLDGSEKTALAFGAPNQASPGVLNNFLYIGGSSGKVFVTETGGAPWRDISAGLSGGGVNQIVANPTRGSRDLYAVTFGGVFYKADSRTNAPWVNITDNLFQLRKPVFGEAVAVGMNPPQIVSLHALAVDWRYAIPDATNLTGAKFPVVYVGGEGGVYRSRSRTTGATWTFYPSETEDGAVRDAGYLPNAQVSDLDLSLGNIDPTTGFPIQNKGGLNLLVASTYGRGAFGIRINTDLDQQFFVNFPSGPQVSNLANPNAVGGPSTSLRVTFNSYLDDRSVSPSDIVLLDTNGAIVPVTGFSKVSGTDYDYDIVFNSQTVAGFYKLTVGENISDLSGNKMNQNNNNANGEADDAFNRYVFLNGAASSLVITGMPTTTIAGTGFDVTVVAQDMTGATILNYTGAVTFSSSDPKVSVAAGDLPPNYTFALTDNGRRTFRIILKDAGFQTLFVDPVIAGSINPAKDDTIVLAADASYFKVTGHPSPSVAGIAATVTVTAFDPFDNQATGYIKTATFTSSDAKATLPANYTFVAGDNGSKTFTNGFTLKIATATASITATDTILGTLTGTQSPIVVLPAAASGLFFESLPDPVTAGVSNNFNLVARDPFGNQATGYLGTVNLTVTDTNGLVSFPTTYTFTAPDLGSKTFPFTLITAGKQTLTATHVGTGVAMGKATTTVKAAAAKTFDVFAFPSPIVAGVTSNFIVTARDAFANKADGYVGTVSFASSDKQASLPFNYVFGLSDAGEKAFSATLKTAATQTITATDTLTATITGTQTGIVVIPAAASQLFAAGFPSKIEAGVDGNITVTLKDAFNNIATGYKGTVSLISSDPQAGLPANYTFTTVDAGVKVLTANLKTAGTQSLTATDMKIAVITGKQSGIVVTPAKASQLFTTGFPVATIAGVTGDVTVTLKDAFNNIATGYKGTVAFTSTDAQAGLPTNYTFTSIDAGVRTFANGVSLKTAGTQSITSTDTLDGTITGTQSGILVIPAKASQLFATGYPDSVAGIAGNLTVTLKDAFNNVATGYTGIVQITSSDIQAGLPANYAFTTGDAGTKVLSANLKTAGLQTLTGTDTVDPTIVGTQSNILITPAAAAKLFATDYPPVVEAGVSNDLKVTLKDAFGNVATGYIGTVRVRSSDSQAGLPANYTFTALDAGVKLLPTSLATVGFQSLTAADTVVNSLTSTVSNIQVVATLAGAVLVTGFPSITTAGVTGGFTVKVLDPFRNTATGYTGTVRFSSTDVLAGLPAEYTFTAADGGIKSFVATLKTSGNQSITATDTVTPTITGVEAGIFVNPATANSLFISSFQSESKANESTTLTVTAKDQFGNIATGFNGTVSFASTDKVGVLPSDFTFSSVEQGVKTFTFSLRTPGFQDVTVSGNNLTSATGTTKVLPSFDTKTTLIGNTHFAVGVDSGIDVLVRSYNAIGTPDFTYVPTPLVGYTGGARVSTADFDGDGVPDIVVGTGPGGATQVVVTNGVTLKEMFTIQPFEAAFTGGVYVTAGDVTGDGIPELIISPDEGGGPRVRVFNGDGFGLITDFFGIDDVNFRGGARAAVGDINGDKVGDLIVAAGFGGGPRVAGYDGRSLGTGSPVKVFADFFAFEQGLRNGIFVAAGDIDGDGKAELIAGGGPGGGPRITMFSGNALLANAQIPVGDFFAGDPNSRGGVRVAVKDLDGDNRADIISGSGTAAGSKVTAYFGKNINGIGQIPEAFSFDAFPGFAGGVFVG